MSSESKLSSEGFEPSATSYRYGRESISPCPKLRPPEKENFSIKKGLLQILLIKFVFVLFATAGEGVLAVDGRSGRREEAASSRESYKRLSYPGGIY